MLREATSCLEVHHVSGRDGCYGRASGTWQEHEGGDLIGRVLVPQSSSERTSRTAVLAFVEAMMGFLVRQHEVNWIRESCLDQSNYLMRSASGSQEVSEVKYRYIWMC